MQTSCYRVYGFTVASGIPFDGLTLCDGPPNVHIAWGDTPERLAGAAAVGVGWELNRAEVLVTVRKLARFLVSASGRITVTPLGACSTHEIQYALLTAAFGPLLHLQSSLLLHASSIAVNGRAVCFLGRSGAGKSTLALACAHRGFPVLTDDLTPVRFADEQPHVTAGPPLLGIWADTFRHFDGQEAEVQRVRRGVEKFKVPVPPAAAAESLTLQAAFVVSAHRSRQVECRPLLGRDAFMAFKTHTRGRRIAESLDMAGYFGRVAKASETIPVYQLWRPDHDLSSLPDVVDTVLQTTERGR